jgi:hypothetical protein
MMCEIPAVETPKKVRSVRFNDNALETIVSYHTDEVQEFDYSDYGHQNEYDNIHNDDAVRLYRRSGSHESLYDKISIETASMNPRLLKKRSSDLDDSNHYSSSSHSYRNEQFDMSMITSSDSNSSHNRSFMSFSGSSSRSRCSDSDLDISHHDRQQRHYNKRVMCV